MNSGMNNSHGLIQFESIPQASDVSCAPRRRMCFVSLAVVAFGLTLFWGSVAQAATFHVTTTADNGNNTTPTAGSLRKAIIDANSNPGTDTIDFNIPGAGVHTISLTALLPTITDPVVINGYTQPGSIENSISNGDNAVLMIQLTGTNIFNFSAFDGLRITAGGSTVEGLIINGFVGDATHDGHGILVTGKGGNVIVGNFIGTDPTGTSKIPNAYGITVDDSPNNLIGGSLAARNIISGNSSGVDIENAGSVGTRVHGNFIGTDRTGTAPLGNLSSGIVMGANQTLSGIEIGGTSTGNGNVISANGDGIGMYNLISGTKIQGNLIGTDVTGKVAIGNGNGIRFLVSGTANVIGGPTTAERNVISGNDGGIVLVNGDQTIIQGNYIGTDITGKGGLGNTKVGIFVASNFNGIGGGTNAEGNVISANGTSGIQITKGAKGNFISRNLIGFGASGATALGNGGSGIDIDDGSDNIIGGSAAGGNAIAFNQLAGVSVLKGTGNMILGNEITANIGLGIDLGTQGSTANDQNDADSGPNNLQNFPVLTRAALLTNGLTLVSGNLNSAPSTKFHIDLYRSSSADASLFGEGEVYMGGFDGTTDANGNASFNGAWASVSLGEFISATATDPAGNTSEFSLVKQVSPDGPGSLQFSSAVYSVNENGGQATITVKRTGGSVGTDMLQYATTAGGTATAGSDFTSVSGTLIWGDFDTADKSFTVPINDDSLNETNETINLTLSNPTNGATLVSPSTAVLTITDNDPLPTVSISDVSQPEGNSGTTNFTFNVTLSAASGQAVKVNYSTGDNTAQAGSDYQSANGVVNFAPGETAKQINVSANGDTQPEPDETFAVNLFSLINVGVGKASGVGTIVNDDGPTPAGTLQFSSASYSVNENAAQATITVKRTGGSLGAVSLKYLPATGGTASAGADFTAPAGFLNWADGDSADKTFTIPILDDSLDEPDETVNYALISPTNGATLGSQSSAVLTIIDDDPAPKVSIDDVSLAEGNSGTTAFTFNVSLSAASGQTVNVNYTTADNTALETSDYQAANGVVTFAPGETSKQVIVQVNGDGQVESNETFAVNLYNLGNASVGKVTGIGTIVNDDSNSTSPTIQFSQATYSVQEDLGAMTVTVTRSGDTSSAASVDYTTVDGSAAPKADFEYAAGTLNFAAGETSKTVTILLNEDALVEGNETFSLTLSNPAGAVLGAQSSTTATIVDDLSEPMLSPVDDAQSFVYTHYHDFLNREPDAAGLAFWTSQITACGTDTKCIEAARVNVSASFFLSIEFQETAYLLYLMQKESYSTMPKYTSFMRDLQEVSRGVVVNSPGWQQKLADNQQQFADKWINRAEFKATYDALSNDAYVSALYKNAGIVAPQAEKDKLVAGLNTASMNRSAVLLEVAEDATFRQQEQNAAFVLMEYFGYLRRDPQAMPDSDLSGYNFWLNKLNQFNGNYLDAEMIKAFITSFEYRQRFGQ